MTARTGAWLRFRVLAATVLLTATSFVIVAAPSLPISRPAALRPQPVVALGCASNPTFTGKLTQQLVNSGTPTTAARITTSTIHAWISNVDTAWSFTAAYRYDGVAYNTTTTLGTFDWGPII